MTPEPRGGPPGNASVTSVATDSGVNLLSLLDGKWARHGSFLPIAHELPIPIYITDPKGFIVYHNAAATQLWGYSPVDGTVRWCGSERLFAPDGTPLAKEDSPMARVLEVGDDAETSEIVGQRRDGSRFVVLPHSRVLMDAESGVMGALHLLVDVTDRDRSAEDTHRLAAIVDGSDDAIVSKQLDGTITSWNSAAERLFGYAADEIIGKSILTLIPEDRQDEETIIVERLRRGERVEHFETVRRHKSGRLLDLSLTISPIKRTNGTIIGASKIVRDITQRKQAEEQLQRQAERLEILNRVARIISQDLDLDRIVQAVTEEATALSGAKFGAFFYNEVDADGENHLLYSLPGIPRAAFDGLGIPRDAAVFATTFAGEGIVRSGDIRKDPRYGPNAPRQGMPVVSYLAVPVIASSGKAIGGLFFGHDEPDRFGPETETLMSAIAAQASVAIDNARLHSAAQGEIAQRKAAEEAQELLLHEVKHRVKNTLATIQALATQTLKGTPVEEKEAFISRLHALSVAHDLLTPSDCNDVGITPLAARSLAAFAGQGPARISLDGPDIGLTAHKALLLTMVLHELGTNAVKYGALSVEQGHVAIAWTRATADCPTLRLEWRESGGPRVAPPSHRGFGSRMIESALHGSEGHADFDYRTDGLRVTLDVVL